MLKSGMSPAGGRAGAPSGAGRCAAGRHEDGPGPWGMPAHGAGTGGCTPHSFSSCRKRMRRARWKKKTLCVQILPIRAGLDKYGGRANQDSRNLAGSRRVRRTAPEQRTCSPHLGPWVRLSGVVIVRALPLAPRVPLRLALPRPFREGNPKGRGRSPSPLSRFKGVWGKQAKRRQRRMKRACFEEAARLAAPKRGRESQCRDGVEIETPPRFSLGGVGGHFSFQKRSVPPLPVSR